MDEGLDSVPSPRTGPGFPTPEAPADPSAVPHGFAVRRVEGRGGVWHDVTVLGEHQVAVAVGYGTGSAHGVALQSAINAALRATSDPARALDALDPADSSALCAVIDTAASQLAYSSRGEAVPVVAAPDVPHRVLDRTDGRLAIVSLPAGSTVLLGNTRAGSVAAELDGCTGLHPDEAADRLMSGLAANRSDGAVVAVVYRHPPAPLTLTVPAEPASLATVRERLRRWLAVAGVGPEPSADVLLAMGEAASNATEHSVVGAGRAVEITVRITVRTSAIGAQLRCTVSDNGRWKSVSSSPGHRGHGLRLINALVDATDLTATDHGTTVDMLKELRP